MMDRFMFEIVLDNSGQMMQVWHMTAKTGDGAQLWSDFDMFQPTKSRQLKPFSSIFTRLTISHLLITISQMGSLRFWDYK